MYERLLNKKIQPTIEEMINYCNDTSDLFIKINEFINSFNLESNIVFPYGNNYGWGLSYKKKKTLICNVFPEANSFTVMVRLTIDQFNKVYNQVQKYTQEIIDHKYPCNEGGWIHYRVKNEVDLDDIKKILVAKEIK